MNLGLQVEFDRERTHILDLESLFHSLVHKNVSKLYKSFFRLDVYLGPNSDSFDHY